MKNSKRLLRLRNLLGHSQREMAEMLGVTPGAIAHWELGKRKMPGPVCKLLTIYEKQSGLDAPSSPSTVLPSIKTGWSERSLAITGLSAQMTIKLFWLGLGRLWQNEAADNALRGELYAAFGKKAVEVIGRLKGLPHKIGQLLSYMDPDMPEDARRHFRTLQNVTPPIVSHQLLDLFLQDFQKSPQQLFATWEPQAFAAASMGQVHRAQSLNGQALAVKVQYPHLRQMIEVDLSHLAILEKMSVLILREHKPGPVIAELRERFLAECDYRLEQKNLEMFGALFRKHAKIRIPKTYPDFCSEHILTTEFLKGQRYEQFLRLASQKQKNAAAHTIWEFVWTSILKHKRFSADPHPGNYVFLGDGKVGFLDFGCVKTIDAKTFGIWRDFLRAVLSGHFEAMFAHLKELGILKNPQEGDQNHWIDLMRSWYAPCGTTESFTFTPAFVKANWKKMTTQNPNLKKIRLPRELVFLNQVQWGLYALLAELKAEGNWDLRSLLK